MRVSFEFFPPKTETGVTHLFEAVRDLAVWQPAFISVTCGAGGAATDGTFAVVHEIRRKFGLTVAPHIAFSRLSRTRLCELIDAYTAAGVRDVVAIRGDAATSAHEIPPDDLYASTIDFVADLKARHGLSPIVSAYPDVHPLAASPEQDLEHLRLKAEAGGTRAISQFFFEAETFLRFRDKVVAAKIPVTLTPGILPIQNIEQTLKFAAGCGAKAPAGFTQRFESCGDNSKAQFDAGVSHAVSLCESLERAGVDALHFYTLNRGAMADAVCAALGLPQEQTAEAVSA